MLLEGKVAVVYGAGGSIGGALARGFAAEGARVFLAGRTLATLSPVVDAIRAGGGAAQAVPLDALDEGAVEQFVDEVVGAAGGLDVSANVISVADVQRPLADLSVEEFLQPISVAMRTQFLTTRAAARRMAGRGGVVLMFGGGGPQAVAGMGGFKVSLDAVESLRRQFAIEYGPQGVRFVTLKTGGIGESVPADVPGRDDLVAGLTAGTQLGRLADLSDVGAVAAFVASDRARSITDTWVNISCGALPE